MLVKIFIDKIIRFYDLDGKGSLAYQAKKFLKGIREPFIDNDI